MISSENNEICDGCGKQAPLQDMQGNEFCDSCGQLARIIQTNPQVLRKICTLIRSDLHKFDSGEQVCPVSAPLDLPEVLDAVRYRTRDRELNTWYVSVSELQGNPVEIFASTAFDRDHHLQSRISNLTTITRLVSLVLRHVFLGEVLSLEKTIKQLHRSSRQKNDLPDMLTRVLSRYIKNPEKIFDDLGESDQGL
jgi:hypothetical protein